MDAYRKGLSECFLSVCLSDCNVGRLWPNDSTWRVQMLHGGWALALIVTNGIQNGSVIFGVVGDAVDVPLAVAVL